MALIKCPECGKEVSNTVIRCIHCGFSINKQTNNRYNEKVVTIQKTGKDIKRQSAIGSVLLVIALACLFFGIMSFDHGGKALIVVGVVLMLMGVAFRISARARKWWHHD